MIKEFNNIKPQINHTAYVDDNAVIIGKVILGENVSVWPGCVLRGDIEDILVDEGSNLQDGVLVHTNHNMPVIIGKDVTVGHGAILHGCRIGNNCLIGMGAIILDGAVIEDDCIIGAGSVVTENAHIEKGRLVLGVPGKIVRTLTLQEINKITKNAEEYKSLILLHKGSLKEVL